MIFNHAENTLTIKAYKADVVFSFIDESNELSHVTIGDQIEIEPNDEVMHAVFVSIDGVPKNLYALMISVIEHYPDILDEAVADANGEAAMADELSSPQLTGRV